MEHYKKCNVFQRISKNRAIKNAKLCQKGFKQQKRFEGVTSDKKMVATRHQHLLKIYSIQQIYRHFIFTIYFSAILLKL